MHTQSCLSLLALSIALALPGAALAQSPRATELDQVVVTGTRTEVSIQDSLVPAQVIDRDEI